jgi:hypothetical protein
MRFSLRTLLLLFPALIVSYGLARCCVYYFAEQYNSTPAPIWCQYQRALWEAQHDSAHSQSAIGSFSDATTNLINSWTAGQISNLPADLKIQAFEKIGRLDLWGRPLQCRLFEYDNPCAPGMKIQSLGFYSCGEDGISDSKGNDPDDLSSWNRMSGNYYSEKYASDDTQFEIYDRQRFVATEARHWKEIIFFLPFTSVAVFFCCLHLRSLFTNPLAESNRSV